MTLEQALDEIRRKDECLKVVGAYLNSPAWQAGWSEDRDAAIVAVNEALKPATRKAKFLKLADNIEVPDNAALRYDLSPYLPKHDDNRFTTPTPDIHLWFSIVEREIPL